MYVNHRNEHAGNDQNEHDVNLSNATTDSASSLISVPPRRTVGSSEPSINVTDQPDTGKFSSSLSIADTGSPDAIERLIRGIVSRDYDLRCILKRGTIGEHAPFGAAALSEY